jgi:hypothetical protein
MAEYRIGRGWSEAELRERLVAAGALSLNFSDALDEMTLDRGWHQYYSEATVAAEGPGPPEPDGPFERGRVVVANYAFSDPRIVIGHFDPAVPLDGRRMLLEMRAFRALHYLAGVVVGATRSEAADGQTVFGFRYDTLEGHIEEGAEWFLLTKDHATGAVRFRIEAAWRPGQFPNWWSRLGFYWVGLRYQRIWHHRAHALLAGLMRGPGVVAPGPARGRLVHTAPEVVFKRTWAPDRRP